MIHNKFRYLLTLVALLAVTTGAWAEETTTVSADFEDGNMPAGWDASQAYNTWYVAQDYWDQAPAYSGTYSLYVDGIGTYDDDYFISPALEFAGAGSVSFAYVTPSWSGDQNDLTVAYSTSPTGPWINTSFVHQTSENWTTTTVDLSALNGTYYIAFISYDNYGYCTAIDNINITFTIDPNAVPITWDATTKTGTFTQPASNVVLTPRYASATIYDVDGETEKMAYETLKEAIQNVQNGETIKLDWDVTVSEPLTTPNRGDNDPISFTLDLNGYILDAETTVEHVIRLNNGDELTISNIRDDKLGGIKGNVIATDNSHIIFDGGRYLFSQSSTAEAIQQGWSAAEQNYGWQMAEGKEFVNVNNGSADNQGFLVRVDYTPFELTIGAGRFATFYDTHNITMIEGNQNISFYTIKRGDIDLDNNVAKVTKVENAIIPAGLPLLVYNGGQQQQTVKLKVTTAEATPIENIAIEFVGTLNGRKFYDEDMAAYDYYALSGGKMFVPVYETGSIAPHKCWIQFLKQQGGARTITIVFDDATAISTVSGSPADTGDIYDLQGRKVQKPARKGVYIKNGQKKVVR